MICGHELLMQSPVGIQMRGKTLASTLLALVICSDCFAQNESPTGSTSITEIQQAIESGDKRFSTRLALAKALAAGGDADAAIEQLHGLLDSGYNPVDAVRDLEEFRSVRNAANYKSLRQRLEPCLGGVHDDFAFTVGTWTISNSANEGNAKDQSEITAVADGCALHEKYWTTYGYEAESFKAYDPVRGKWSMLIVDNQGFFLNFVQVPGNDGDDIVLEARDETAIYRATSRQIDEDTFHIRWLWSRDGGSTWAVYVDSEYHRA